MDELTAEIEVPATAAVAFELFTDEFGRWWPPEFSWSGAELLTDIGILDGVLYELGPHGLQWDWGRVLVWEPARRFVFSWQIGPDRVPVPRAEDASEVEVTFDGSSVRVAHRGWERHGEAGEAYRENFRQVWPYALGRFAEHVANSSQR
ncbi:SRPBCC domain-containing protein [Kribbella sp. HUAS MG21]|uniref:SRPBCC domain-containing protein n=1 Tax=Kribbella sp. HUAS MG21 TaxID=3160966 RepID=A0AAU7T9A5_9ACTN